MAKKIDMTRYRMETALNEWASFKVMKIKTYNVEKYKQIIRRALLAIIEAKREGRTRADVTQLQWAPDKIGEDEVKIILEVYGNRELYLGRLNDFLVYFNNAILKRTIFQPNMGQPRRKAWFKFAEMALIRKAAMNCSPLCEFVLHMLSLGVRPIGIMRLEMEGIQFQGQRFSLRDKGKDRRDKELGKACKYCWDGDTLRIVHRYLDWREQLYLDYEAKHSRIIPRDQRVVVHVFRHKVIPFGATPYIGAKGIQRILNELKAVPELYAIAPLINPYNIRRTRVAHLVIMSQVKDEQHLTNDDIQRLMNWESPIMIQKYQGEMSQIFELMKIKEREAYLLNNFADECEKYDDLLAEERGDT